MAYTSVTITGYNTSPPPDDGSEGTTNQVAWSKIKTKLFDPLRDAFQVIDDNALAATNTADADVATLEADIATLATSIATLPTAMRGPSGTVVLFRQDSPPTGWTKNTDLDGYALRLTTGTIGTGGSTAFTSVFAARTIATANLPTHSHSFSQSDVSASFSGSSGSISLVYDVSDSTTAIEGDGNKTFRSSVNNSNSTVSGTFTIPTTATGSTGSGSTWDFAVQYVDTIAATKS